MSRSYVVSVEWDAVGNATRVRHEDAARPQDTLETVTSWVEDTSGTRWVPRSRGVWAASAADPAVLALVEQGEWWYDGGGASAAPTDGRPTAQRVCGGAAGALCSPAERLDWEFGWTERGALDFSFAPGGRARFVDALGFGEAAVLDEQNALGHTATAEVDDLGRVRAQVDANGVETVTTVDGFGRVVAVERRGVGAPVSILLEATVYHDESVPLWSETTRYRYDGAGQLIGDDTTSTVLDGFGQPLQVWTEALSGAGYVVSETERDARGQVRSTSLPHEQPAFSLDYRATRSSVLASWAVKGRVM